MLEEAIRVMEEVGLEYDAGGGSIEDLKAVLAQWRAEGSGG
jgi:hypothetical protein